jgi:hypothetical protein
MHRDKIVARILLILSVVHVAAAAPALIRQRQFVTDLVDDEPTGESKRDPAGLVHQEVVSAPPSPPLSATSSDVSETRPDGYQADNSDDNSERLSGSQQGLPHADFERPVLNSPWPDWRPQGGPSISEKGESSRTASDRMNDPPPASGVPHDPQPASGPSHSHNDHPLALGTPQLHDHPLAASETPSVKDVGSSQFDGSFRSQEGHFAPSVEDVWPYQGQFDGSYRYEDTRFAPSSADPTDSHPIIIDAPPTDNHPTSSAPPSHETPSEAMMGTLKRAAIGLVVGGILWGVFTGLSKYNPYVSAFFHPSPADTELSHKHSDL